MAQYPDCSIGILGRLVLIGFRVMVPESLGESKLLSSNKLVFDLPVEFTEEVCLAELNLVLLPSNMAY